MFQKLRILSRGTDDSDGEEVFRRVNPHCFSESIDDGSNGLSHGARAKLESVDVRAWFGDLINAYVQREVGICLYLHAALPALDVERGDFAVLIFKNESVSHGSDLGDVGTARNPQERPDVAGLRGDDVKLPMSVLSRPVVQHTDGPIQAVGQFLRHEIGDSTVRLYRFNDVPLLVREWRDLPTTLVEGFLGGADRKYKVVLVGGRALAGVHAGDLVDRSIESGAQLIQELAKFEWDAGGHGAGLLDGDVPPPVVIHISMGVVRFFFDERIPSSGDSIAVGVCAPDTLPTNIEWFSHA